ncbi:BPSS1780 family membrane protein [Denitratisoma oestradiolicum]|uniref:Transmembrane protein n=1 Tax=Denitratisoma oestradiolicum TaxID=311182 RepID=A0A6S6Y4K2_9PROT|nr:BPSS1780 family membrane protein [Denitratisoma oestradiolicum]TWO79315.1 hypothetical protein CBW56_15515 [Denitratisoma oestradiolicum]CAB1370357.1 conserved membrane protein of unknown function [Denitratisoma oestradiolicum]
MQAHRLPARHGVLWLVAGFRLFRTNPPLLTALTLGYFFAVLVVNLLPLVGPFLLTLGLPSLTLVVANGCREIEAVGALRPGALFHGLREHRKALLQLGGLNLLASLVLLLALVLSGLESVDLVQPDPEQLMRLALLMLVLAIPLLLAFWFAPMLTGWEGVTPMKSVFFSIVATVRNWRVFAVYGLAVGTIGVALPGLLIVLASLVSSAVAGGLAMFLRMAMMLVLAPVLMASVYLSYRDVFVRDA